MGGLCTAARLADRGYRVLVIESQSHIGGRCSTRCRDGFKLTTGVVGIECGGIVEDFFHTLGLPFDVRPADDLRYLIGGVPVKVPAREGMKHLLTAAGGDAQEIEQVMEAISRGIKWQAPTSDLTLREWLAQYTRDSRLEKVFQTLVAAPLMVEMEEISVADFFHFINHLGRMPRFGYAPGGAIALATALERHILKNHGEVWTRAEAIRIPIENRAARGAVVRHLGKEEFIEASVVVSNTGPLKTAGLVGREKLDLDDLRTLDAVVCPARAICLQIATDRPLFSHTHLWIAGCQRIRRLYQPTVICPELAPKGRHLLVVMASAPGASSGIDLEAEMAICRADLETIYPEFPKTAEVLAADAFYGDRPAMHARPGRDAPAKTSVINLYNVGDGVKSPGSTGLPAVVEAAEQCARDVCRRINLIESTAASS